MLCKAEKNTTGKHVNSTARLYSEQTEEKRKPVFHIAPKTFVENHYDHIFELK